MLLNEQAVCGTRHVLLYFHPGSCNSRLVEFVRSRLGCPSSQDGTGWLGGLGCHRALCASPSVLCQCLLTLLGSTGGKWVHGNVLCAGSRELSTASGPFVTQEDRNTDTCTAGPECPSSAHSQSSSLDWQLSFPRARFGCEIFLIFPRASQYSFPVPPV